MIELRGDLALAREAALEAGRVVLPAFGRDHVVDHKSPSQPVTAADLEADALLRSLITGERPDDGWLSEETADAPDRLRRDRVWIVDPIDGTGSFIAGIPEFTISIALAVAGHAQVGAVFNPVSGELFYAERGRGAWLEAPAEAEDARLTRLRVGDGSGSSVLLASRAELAAGEFATFGEWSVEPRGSTAYKLAGVAAGRGTAFFSRGPKSEWDVCAGALIVEEAGGRVTDLAGEPLRYNRADPAVDGILATSGVGHDALLRRIGALPPPTWTESKRRDGS